MVKFSVELVQKLLHCRNNIRNFSVIAHVDHGKSTLTDSLLAAAGLVNLEQAGDLRSTDSRADEKERGITIKSTGVTLHYQVADDFPLPPRAEGRDFLFNLIDSPGHVDFSSEVTAALRVTDGALVVVDCVEGVCVQTETVLRQALAEGIKPILCINKLDRAFLELGLSDEELYQNLCRIVESANVLISTYEDASIGDCTVSPERGTVAFASGIQGWAFTLDTFAKMYSTKNGVPVDKMRERLWGDHYFNPSTKKWQTSPATESGGTLERGFCQFVAKQLRTVFQLCMDGKVDEISKLMSKNGVSLSDDSRLLAPKPLLKRVMQQWLPAGPGLLQMIIQHLPSPAAAQTYRVENLYKGPLDDNVAQAIRTCDPEGPLVVYVSKMIPVSVEASHFLAFGRVFSGTVRAGQKALVLTSSYQPGQKDAAKEKTVHRTLVMIGKRAESVDAVPCGNTCALAGIDQSIQKTCTLVDSRESWPLRDMSYSVSPVVRVAVTTKSPSELPKLVDALKRLSKTENVVQCYQDKSTGEYLVAGAGELHLEICLHDLQDMVGEGVELVVGTPAVSFRETVSAASSLTCMTKSPNHHNRLYCVAEPLNEALCREIEEGKISPSSDPKERARKLVDDHGWNPQYAKKIWCFGPERTGPNILVDGTHGQPFMSEIKDSALAAFQWATDSGVLCDENLRGCQFNFVDVVLHGDAVHRGAGQVIPAARRVFAAAQLSASPRLVEPIFLVDIQTVKSAVGPVYSLLHKRRGKVVEEVPRANTPILNIRAHLPVVESFGFVGDLRAATAGRAFPQCVFDHWSVMAGNPLDDADPANAKVNELVKEIRKRKGLTEAIPSLDYYNDKL